MQKPAIERILNIFIVVRDLEATVRTYESVYAIGPWTIQDFTDANVPQKWVREQECAYQAKIATCSALNVGLALVQPLDDRSIFAEFLRDNGPGLFHLLVHMRDGFDSAKAQAQSRDLSILQRGRTTTGTEYAHVDFRRDLGMVLEMFKIGG